MQSSQYKDSLLMITTFFETKYAERLHVSMLSNGLTHDYLHSV
jgi:hypothetical protein